MMDRCRFFAIVCGVGLVLVFLLGNPGKTSWGLDASAAEREGLRKIKQNDVPFVISMPGSYHLAENLTVGDPQVVAAILVDADVTIDLQGFTITGPGKGPSCATELRGFGVNTTVRSNVTVRNGVVTSFCNVGVHLPGTNNPVENVKVVQCGSDGIFVGSNSVVRHNQVAYCFNGVTVDSWTGKRRNDSIRRTACW